MKSPVFSTSAFAEPARNSTIQLTEEEELSGDSEPLLKLAEESLTKSNVSAEQSAVLTEVTGGSGRRKRWQDICTVVCLWISYLLCSAAYSVIGPFFPKEVGVAKLVVYSPIANPYFSPRVRKSLETQAY